MMAIIGVTLWCALVVTACARPQQPSTTDNDPTSEESTVPQVADTPTADTSIARSLLANVELHQELVAPVPYVRDDYSPGGWSDSDGDCQSDRHEVLIAESLAEVTLTPNGCRVESGLWTDRFDGNQYERADQVTIDHLVALSAAHRAGAWEWDLESKQRFAHDIDFPGALGVTGPSINQTKADQSPDQWRPPLQSAWCSYATDWIKVKARWQLAFTVTEAQALDDMLATCDTVDIEPVELAHPTLAPVVELVEPTPVEITATAASVVIGACDARSEVVTLENRGLTAASLDGWILHDRHQNHSLRLDGITLQAGDRVVIGSGEQPANTGVNVVWKGENVWNNSGDTATLIGPSSETVSVHDC